MFNNNAVRNSLHLFYPPPNNSLDGNNLAHAREWPPASSNLQTSGTISSMRQQGRMQHAQASSFRQFSLGQIRALSIDQLLRQRYGLYLIGELPNLSEASEHQIRNALATLNPRSNDASVP